MLRRVFFIILFLFPALSFAKSPAGIPSEGIWFSKEPFFAGEEISISTVVFNSSKYEIEGTVELLDNDKLIESKKISLSPNDNKIVSFKLQVTEGKHSFKVRVADTNINDTKGEVVLNSSSSNAYYSPKSGVVSRVVFKDSDSDGISDIEDTDIDGDSLTNTEEKKLGTDPKNPDTDSDGILDGADKRPLKIDTIPSTVTPITESDTKKVANSVEKVIPKNVVEPVVSVAVPVIGAVESFRVGQANNVNGKVESSIDTIIDKVGTSKVLGTSDEAKQASSTSLTKTGKPTGWSVFKRGVTEKDQFVKTPFGYVKLAFFLILSFILSHTWIFYIVLLAVIIKILIFIKKLIFNRGE